MAALLWSWDPPSLRHDFKEGPGAVQYVPKVKLTLQRVHNGWWLSRLPLALLGSGSLWQQFFFFLLFCHLDSCLLVLLLPMHLTLKSRYIGLTRTTALAGYGSSAVLNTEVRNTAGWNTPSLRASQVQWHCLLVATTPRWKDCQSSSPPPSPSSS